MTLYTKQEISHKLNSLAKRIDSVLEFTHLHLSYNDVKFLTGMAIRFSKENNQKLEINLQETYFENYIIPR